MLERLGYEVVGRSAQSRSAGNLPQALDRCAFDLVITDMTMPHMPGVELTRELLKLDGRRSESSCAPASANWSPRKKALRQGILAFIMKPLVMPRARRSCSQKHWIPNTTNDTSMQCRGSVGRLSSLPCGSGPANGGTGKPAQQNQGRLRKPRCGPITGRLYSLRFDSLDFVVFRRAFLCLDRPQVPRSDCSRVFESGSELVERRTAAVGQCHPCWDKAASALDLLPLQRN